VLTREEGDEAKASPVVEPRVPARPTPIRRRWAPDALGVAWTVLAAVIVLVRALHPGASLGPFDLLSRFGLTGQTGITVHNAIQADQIQQFVPWTNLAWYQVHGGQLPLWNSYNVLGMPLAFNWQSSVFSVPTALSYLFPVRYAFTVIVMARLLIAGTGAYTLCRVVGVGSFGAAFGGTVFELSGPMIDHAGWPHTAVTCWAGWIVAAIVLLVRGRHRLRDGALVALFVAGAVYGGHPESLVVLGVALVVFLAVWLAVRARMERATRPPTVRPLVLLLVAGVCGLGLGAPLLLPGTQLGLTSVRRNGSGVVAFPLTHLPNLVAAGLQGQDFTTSAYVGLIALALAAVGVWAGRRRPEVWALAVLVVLSTALTFLSPVDQLFGHIPGAHTITWNRAVMLLALGVAILAAFGIDAVVRSDRVTGGEGSGTLARWVGGAFVVGGGAVLVLLAGSVLGISHLAKHRGSLLWPAVQAGAGLAVAGALWWRCRRRSPAHGRRGAVGRGGAVVLFAVESVFLLSTGASFWSVSSSYFPTNPAVAELQDTVGTSLVGYGSCRALAYLTASQQEVGIRPDANVAYRIREMAVYDPILPQAYLRSWMAAGGAPTPHSLAQLGIFCARIVTAQQARLFGVQYVLEPAGRRGPLGAVFDRLIGDERLYSIPGAADAAAVPVAAGGAAPSPYAPGTPVPVTHPDPASWHLEVQSTTSSVLRLRLTNVPGWRATIDGRSLALEPWANGAMVEARIPPGSHVVDLHYWPPLFSDGLVIAAVVVAVLVLSIAVAVVMAMRRGRKARRAPASAR